MSTLSKNVSDAETIRNSNENTRKTNETSRINAERKRQSDSSTAISNVNTAKTNCETQTTLCKNATESCSTATSNANTAATNANTATKNMNTLLATSEVTTITTTEPSAKTNNMQWINYDNTISETIASGLVRKLWDKTHSVWKKMSFWTKASDVEFSDTQTAESKVGAIKGITTSTSVTNEGYAADAKTVSEIKSSVTALNNTLLTETLFNNDFLFITKCGNSITATFRGLEISSPGTLVGVIDSKYFPKSPIFVLVADGISMESKVLLIGTSGQLRPYSQSPAALSTTIKATGQAKWDI